LKQLIVFGLLAVLAPFAQAEIFSFDCITNNNATNCGIGEAQLQVEVKAGGGANQVAFVFTNSGPAASSITDVYFDDGSLLGIASITDSGAGVDFSQGASPGNLSGGNTIDFNATSGFTADSNPPTQPNGVNPGESLTITFNLVSGQTLSNTLAALALGLANPGVDVAGGLRIGIHVQGFAGGGSESFVNNGPGGQVPEPGSVLLFGTVLAGAGLIIRRRQRA
jgi:hypothetical protein